MANKKNRRIWITIGLILIIGVLATLAVMRSKNKKKGEQVTIEKAEKRTIKETVSASGRVFPETEVKMSSDVSGEIVELYVAEGDSVTAGQLLAKIDPEAYLSAVERGKASLNSAKASLAMSKSSRETNIAQKEQILAQLENARRIHDRNIKLKEQGIISEADFEGSLSSLQGLEANLKSAEANIRSAEQSIDGAQYNVKSSEASLKELETSLNRTTIKSPVDGIVSRLSVEQGERVVGTIQMTGTEMMRIANLNSMEVQVDVSENDIIRVKEDDFVEIEVDAYLDRKFTGRVSEIANTASNVSTSGVTTLNTDQVTNFIVKVRIDQESYADLIKPGDKFPFRPGMSASVDIYTNEKSDIVSIPIQAVTTREKEDIKKKKGDEKASEETTPSRDEYLEVVFVVQADTVEMREVKTGIQDDEYIEVLNGIDDGEQIVTGPYATISKKLEQGDAVYEKEEEEKGKKK